MHGIGFLEKRSTVTAVRFGFAVWLCEPSHLSDGMILMLLLDQNSSSNGCTF